MLHTIRQVVNDDEKWRQILRGLNKTFYHQTVTTKQIENYISSQAGIDLSKVFDQYLRNVSIPRLEYKTIKNKFQYRWTNCIEGFDMPIKLSFNNNSYEFVYPTTSWKTLNKKGLQEVKIDEGFYIEQKINDKFH